jgi:hypothetical protein
MQRKLLGIINVDFEATDQLLTIYDVFVKYPRRNQNTREAVHQTFTDFKKAFDRLGGRCGITFSLSLVSA